MGGPAPRDGLSGSYPPCVRGVSIGDTLGGGSTAWLARSSRYYHQVKVNGGAWDKWSDVALYEAVFATMESLLPEYSLRGVVRGGEPARASPASRRRMHVSCRCRDGAYAHHRSEWRRPLSAPDGGFIGRTDLAQDPTLAHNDGRVARNDELDRAIAEWTLEHDIGAVICRLELAEVPVGRSFTVADIAEDPQYHERQMLEKHALPRGGPDILVPGIVPKLSRTPGETRWLGPEVGQHTSEVLASLGLGPGAIDLLKAKGII